MCLAVPGKIISIDNSNPDLRMAKVEFGGVVKDICIQWLDDSKIGDYVMAHVGTALSKLDEKDALITLNSLKQMGEINDV